MSEQLPYLDEQAITALVSWRDAVTALDEALTTSLDPAEAMQRSIVDVTHGQLLMMPAQASESLGVKIATVAPNNPTRGLPRIHALYILFDQLTLQPLALMDGTALTTLRTPSVSAVAADHLAAARSSRLTVFGSGPQAWGHVHALAAIRPVSQVTVVAREQAGIDDLVSTLQEEGFQACSGTADSVAQADLVVCATTAREPVFDGRMLADHACVMAVGSHEADAREVDITTMRRAGRVAVESRDNVLREGGDVIHAIAAGIVTESDLMDLGHTVTLEPAETVSVFKSCGMGWQDLVIASLAYQRWTGS